MRRQTLVLSFVILGSAVSCGGDRVSADGSADSRNPDWRVPAIEAGGTREANPETGDSGDSLGVDARSSTVEGGSATYDLALPVPDSDITSPDSLLVIPDGDTMAPLDAWTEVDAPVMDTGDEGVPPDTAPPTPDLGVASPPDAVADAANDTELDTNVVPLPCKVPDCWANLMRDCQPTGTCSVQSDAGYENLCFPESVKVLTTVDEVAGKMITTVMKSGQICYQLDWDLAAGAVSGATATGVLKNGSGVLVATIGDDLSGYSVVTCTGTPPVVLSEGCDFVGPVLCEAGTCGL